MKYFASTVLDTWWVMVGVDDWLAEMVEVSVVEAFEDGYKEGVGVSVMMRVEDWPINDSIVIVVECCAVELIDGSTTGELENWSA